MKPLTDEELASFRRLLAPVWEEGEQAILGMCLLSEDAVEMIFGLSQDDRENLFYEEEHQMIWCAMEKLRRARAPVDPVSVFGMLGGHAGAPPLEYLIELQANCGATTDIREWLSLLRRVAAARNRIEDRWEFDRHGGASP